ncbi:MAG: IS982 family transposase [Candidatus Delongbacteria bacterium]|nr:IS982 family transposase [Candidatus Delongbacteria bacterium]MBN2835765.1 IS982 family transposase [Candidatus Delongbacteria bacterium]
MKEFDKFLDSRGIDQQCKIRKRDSSLSNSEVMSILILFHLSGFRELKNFYIKHVKKYYTKEFPGLVSYNRFVELQKNTILPMIYFLLKSKTGEATGISFVDSTPIKVCNNRRIHSNRVFRGYAERGHSSIGYFYGFKLHLVINDKGEILSFMITKGNVDDREPLKNENFIKKIFGKLFGDKGYISKDLKQMLFVDGINLITKLKKNMKGEPLSVSDKVLLRKRAVIESVNDELKNICQIEHTRRRSFANFFANLLSGLISYAYRDKKPSLKLNLVENDDYQLTLF